MTMNKLNNKIISQDVENIINNDLPWGEFTDTTVLITGASGMIPSYVVYTLLGLNDKLNANIKVIGLVRNEEKAKKIFGSLLNRTDFELLVQDVCQPVVTSHKIDYIFHGGSAARPAEHKSAPTSTIKANLIGTFNLLDLAVEKHSKAFVLMSSSEVYGQIETADSKIKEMNYGSIDILNPRSCYSEGKRAAETICTCYEAQYGIKCKIPRFAHIYGPGMALNDGRVQTDFASKVFYGQNIIMNSDGSSKRAYTYVSDAVCGIFYILLKGQDMAYNVANDNSIITIKQLAEAFLNARPEKDLELVINVPKEQSNLYNPAKYIGLDGSKLKTLGWIPKVDINTGCDRMLAHYELTEKK